MGGLQSEQACGDATTRRRCYRPTSARPGSSLTSARPCPKVPFSPSPKLYSSPSDVRTQV